MADPPVRAATADDLSAIAALGVAEPVVMRAMAQQMAWVVSSFDGVTAVATARLADGTVFLDALAGAPEACLTLIDHALAYARWSYAPALVLSAPLDRQPLEDRGFVGLETTGLPPELAASAPPCGLMMRRL